jgi:hypothetical protein
MVQESDMMLLYKLQADAGDASSQVILSFT